MNAPRRRNPRDDPFHDGPRPTPGHDMGDRYDYRKECPPEQTRERDRSTGIADAYYAAYLRGEVDLADPPETDSYPRDEPGFNPIGPRWKMPDGTWFGEGDPEPRRMFDKEAYDKKENWGSKEELMLAARKSRFEDSHAMRAKDRASRYSIAADTQVESIKHAF